MIIKNLFLWKKNASWSDEDFVMFGVIVISLVCSAFMGLFTYFGVGIFGPWFLGSDQTILIGWAAPFVTQFYFWGRWARYSIAYRQGLLSKTGKMVGRDWFKWFRRDHNKKHEAQLLKIREREIALGFAKDIRK